MKIKILSLVALILIVTTSCIKDGVETLPLQPVCKNRQMNQIIPAEYLVQLKAWMAIYDGKTPPNICGCYLADSPKLKASTITNDAALSFVALERFSNQNEFNMIYWEQKSKIYTDEIQTSKSVEGYIYGAGDNFTAFFDVVADGKYLGSSATSHEVIVISGTKTVNGIKNFQSALLMLEKDDPDNVLVPVGTIRIFEEADKFAENSTWSLFKTSVLEKTGNNGLLFNQLQGVK